MRGEMIDIPRYLVFMPTPSFDGDLEELALWAGQSCALVHDVLPAAEIVTRLVQDAEAALDSLTAHSSTAS